MNEKTPEDVQFAKLLRSGIMRLGEPATPAEPEPFRHVLRWDLLNRKGQHCRILKQRGPLAQIEFETDGFKTWINRSAIVRRRESAHDGPNQAVSGGSQD